MNLYNAIMKAADHIEKHPTRFRFSNVETPRHLECGSPGCALGWIGFFSGEGPGCTSNRVAEKVLGLSEMEFYRRVNDLTENEDRSWIAHAPTCAKGLRLYAEKYHGHEKRNFAREMMAKLEAEPLKLTHESMVA